MDFKNCYTLQGSTENQSLLELSAENFANTEFFEGWDFTSTWDMDDFLGRPVLRGVTEPKQTEYNIYTAGQLRAFSECVNDGETFAGVTISLMDDIDLEGAAFTPIGSLNYRFAGIFDGGGHKISGLNVSESYAGLFGYTNGAEISGLSVEGSVEGETYAAGIVVSALNTSIENCLSSCTLTVTNPAGRVGGIVGKIDGTQGIANCLSLGNQLAASVSMDVKIENCYSSAGWDGEVTGVTEAQLASGEVAYLLQKGDGSEFWSQKVGTDGAPSLRPNAYAVIKVSFKLMDGKEFAAAYCNKGGSVAQPAENPDVPEGAGEDCRFYGWRYEENPETPFYEEDKFDEDTSLMPRYKYYAPADPTGLYSIDYAAETIKAAEGYEISYDYGANWFSGEKDVEPGQYIFLRRPPEPELGITISDTNSFYAPARPAAPDVSGGEEIITGAELTMEYSADNGANWTPFDAETLGHMEPGEYLVRYAATGGAFASANAAVTVYEMTGSLPETYAISVVPSEHGTVKPSLNNASAGSTITLAVTPEEGYELAYITVNGERISGGSFKMPACDVEIKAAFAPVGSVLPFEDVVPGSWYYDYVVYVWANGLMDGTGATVFAPDAGMTRAMVWAILARMDGETATGASWLEDARAWAVESGVSDGSAPDAPVTREQLATMLWRYAGEPEASGSLAEFTDAGSVSSWAVEAMSWAVDNGIITGASETTLAPQGSATRAQAAAMLMRFHQGIK